MVCSTDMVLGRG
jgi:hypothetical protein